MAYTADAVIREAEKWVGYLEKSKNGTDAQLIDKNWSPGSANITWFWVWLDRNDCLKGLQGDAWCDAFVDFCHAVVGGVERARESLNGFSAYTPDSADRFKRAGRWIEANGVPAGGDQIFFKNSKRIYHTGIVTKVTPDRVYGVEGNTSSEDGVVANGGGVWIKSYSRSDPKIAGYGRPAYDKVAIRKPNLYNVRQGQTMLNAAFRAVVAAACGGPLEVDGKYGQMTRDACLAAWKYVANHGYGADLTVANHNFGDACREAAKKMQISLGAQNQLVYIAQTILSGHGYYDGAMDAQAGPTFDAATRAFQAEYGLTADGVIGPDTWGQLFGD